MPSQHGADPAKSSPLKLSSQYFLPPLPKQTLTMPINRFSDEYPDAHFVKLDVDEVPDVAQELGIRAMPTFLIFKDEEKIQEVVGANPKALLAAIQSAVKP
jgi:thioredoxin 1